ncbi:MAG: hypothetical protein IT373_03380 [Polyangiaceae bacterium]|nr:hypothetical protein [Polyangiaceae bacterium]
MPRSLPTPEDRVLLCLHCAAPVEVPRAGGKIRCAACGASSPYGARTEAKPTPSALSEPARFDRLRAEDGTPMMPPPNLQHFLAGGGLAPELVKDALAEWQKARTEVRAGASFGSAERLYFLTLMLYGQLSTEDDLRRTFGLLETALGLLPSSRHAQVLRGMLARTAARAGDLEAARAWLAALEPRSEDLYEDTAYRFATAYVATAAGDFATVLQVLGEREGDVPIADGQDEVCAMLRANAHERLGRPEQALALLRDMLATAPERLVLFERIVETHPRLELCPASFATLHAEVAARVPAARKLPRLLLVPLVTGVALPAVLLVVAFTTDPAARTGDGMPMRTFWLLFAGIWAAVTLVPGALLFAVARRASRHAAYLREHGLPGVATLIALEETSTTRDPRPLCLLTYSVRVGSEPPFEVRRREAVSRTDLPRYQPGLTLRVRIDPRDRARFLVEDEG